MSEQSLDIKARKIYDKYRLVLTNSSTELSEDPLCHAYAKKFAMMEVNARMEEWNMNPDRHKAYSKLLFKIQTLPHAEK